MSPSLSTIKRLCAVSRNSCAFTGCLVILVDDNPESFLGEICHIKAQSPGGPRYDKKQTDEERHAFDNLILMCGTHHTLIDSDEVTYNVERLLKMKTEHRDPTVYEIPPIAGIRAQRLLEKYEIQIQGNVHIGAVHAQSVHFHVPKRSEPKISLSPDLIGGSPSHFRYIDHLLKRYKSFASQQKDRVYRYGAIEGIIQRDFGTSWKLLEVERFEEISVYLQKKIDGTIFGKRNRSMGKSNYSSFGQYGEKYGHK